MRKAQPTTGLLAALTIAAVLAAFLVRDWAAGCTQDALLQAIPAALAYGAALYGMSRLTELDARSTITGSLHLLLAPAVAVVLVLAMVAASAEHRVATAGERPAWGTQLADAAHRTVLRNLAA